MAPQTAGSSATRLELESPKFPRWRYEDENAESFYGSRVVRGTDLPTGCPSGAVIEQWVGVVLTAVTTFGPLVNPLVGVIASLA